MNRWSEWLDLLTHPAVVLAALGVMAGAIITVGAPYAWLLWVSKVLVVLVPGLQGLKAVSVNASPKP